MQSANSSKRSTRMKRIAATTGRPKGIGDTAPAAMTGGAGPAILVMLFLASAAYVVFGGAYETASSPEGAISVAAAALEPADGHGAARKQNASGSSAEPTDYFPAGYVNRGRDGDGNVMTYEHD